MKNFLNKIIPHHIDQIIGHSKYLNSQGLIRLMVEKSTPLSLILYGPSGIGKSSLAIAIAESMDIDYKIFNPSIDNKQKLMEMINSQYLNQQPLIIIIDEIHRLHQDKQDIFLPLINNNNIYIFATTTENPYFCINPAIRSRTKIIELSPITRQEMFDGIQKMLNTNFIDFKIDESALMRLCELANGDVRNIINNLYLLMNLFDNQEIDLAKVNIVQENAIILGGHYGDEIHNLKSAFQKSIRGSDINASLYYLARLLKLNAIDDLLRRLLIVAYEDIGLADPELVNQVVNGVEAFKFVGMPEGQIILANLVINLCLSNKSNSACLAIKNAMHDIENGLSLPIPKFLWDSHYQSASKLGVTGYVNPHTNPNFRHTYLPEKIKDKKYYISNPNDWYKKKKSD